MPPAPSPPVSVVIPVRGQGESLCALVERIDRALEGQGEIILVDDANPEPTREAVAALARDAAGITALHLSPRAGQHAATAHGVQLARGSVVVTMDDDLQHPPEWIPPLLTALDGGLDLVYGKPASDPRGLHRRLSAILARSLLRVVTGRRGMHQANAFRAFRRGLRSEFPSPLQGNLCLDVMLAWQRPRVGAIAVPYRRTGPADSSYSPGKLLALLASVVRTARLRP